MIFFDTETTGLITNEALPLDTQPYIIEVAAMKTDEQGNEIARFESLVNAPVPITPEITKITGIAPEDVLGAPSFASVYFRLAQFFSGETTMVAHNASFDHNMLIFELRRLGKQYQFPYPTTVIDSRIVWRGKLQDWGRAVRGEKYIQRHRAMADVELLRDCYFSGVSQQ